MAAKKDKAREMEVSNDGNRAIDKFKLSDAAMMLILIILCHREEESFQSAICILSIWMLQAL